MSGAKLKPFPKFETDAEAEVFVENADLAEYDFSGFKPMQFKFETKSVSSDGPALALTGQVFGRDGRVPT